MNKILRYALLPVMLCLAVILPAGGSRDKKVQEEEFPRQVIRITGTVKLVGSEPFPCLVISGTHEWYIDMNDVQNLRNLQHRRVTVEGVETVNELRFANGMPAGERRTLSQIKIICVE